MVSWSANAVAIFARICLVLLFPFSAYDKIVHWRDALKQASSSFVPAAPVLLVMAIIVEFVTPVCIVIAWHTRAAALILAAFCVVTAILYHPFWQFADFWSKDGVGRSHFWDFLKNFGLVGGLLLLALYGPLAPAAAFRPSAVATPTTHVQWPPMHTIPVKKERADHSNSLAIPGGLWKIPLHPRSPTGISGPTIAA
ncbi:MAG: DoxX family protein [Acidiferrobacter sp.]